MALIAMNSFDHYLAGGGAVTREGIGNAGVITTTGRSSPRCVRYDLADGLTGGGARYIRANSALMGMGIGIAIRVGKNGGWPSDILTPLLRILTSGSQSAAIVLRASGAVEVRDYVANAGGGTLLASLGTLNGPEQWNHIELRAYGNADSTTAGLWEATLNGSAVNGTRLWYGGAVTGAMWNGVEAGIGAVMTGSTLNHRVDIDDLYIEDTYALHGDQPVGVLWPNGEGFYNELPSPPSGEQRRWVILGEEQADGSTSSMGVTSPAATGNRQSFRMSNIASGTPIAVNAVLQRSRVNSINPPHDFSPFFRNSAGTDWSGSTALSGTAGASGVYTFWEQVVNLSPFTSSAWTTTEINDMEAGLYLLNYTSSDRLSQFVLEVLGCTTEAWVAPPSLGAVRRWAQSFG